MSIWMKDGIFGPYTEYRFGMLRWLGSRVYFWMIFKPRMFVSLVMGRLGFQWDEKPIGLKLDRLPCLICGKEKGQPPQRCNGHYSGTSSDPLI